MPSRGRRKCPEFVSCVVRNGSEEDSLLGKVRQRWPTKAGDKVFNAGEGGYLLFTREPVNPLISLGFFTVLPVNLPVRKWAEP